MAVLRLVHYEEGDGGGPTRMPQRPDKRYRPHSLQDHTQGHYQSKRNFIEILTNPIFYPADLWPSHINHVAHY